MEFLSRIEIQGIVGSVSKTSVVDDVHVRVAVATDHIYSNEGGSIICETTWHYITGFESKLPATKDIKKGDAVNVKGRLTMRRYVGEGGCERVCPEVIASEFTVLEKS